jgi:hypothetical protein
VRGQRFHAWLLATALSWVTGCVEDVLLGRECPGPTCLLDAGHSSLDAGRCAPADASACACETGVTLLAHWPLDERSGQSARDVVGSADGVLRHGPSQEPWVAGQVLGALAFDGVNDGVDVGMVRGSLRSLSFWLRAGSTSVVTERTPLRLPTSHGPLDQWNDPERAYADDDMAATVASLLGTEAQHWGGFHLGQLLPQGAVPRGITVTVDTGNLGLLGMLTVELSWDGGSSHTGSRYGWGQLIVGSNLRQAGGVDKLWGREWAGGEFSDASFRVRASFGGIANAMALDYVGVQVEYAPQTLARTVMGLRPGVYIAFAGDSLASVGWPATTYVNGAANGRLRDGWNHVAVVGSESITASNVQLGAATLDSLSFPLEGLLDEVMLFGAPLTAAQIEGLGRAPGCR